MKYALLALIVIFLAFGWLNAYVCRLALISLMEEKGIPPSQAEVKEHLMNAWLKTLKLK